MVPQEHVLHSLKHFKGSRQKSILLRAFQNYLALIQHLLYVEIIVIQVFEKMFVKIHGYIK